jgi:cytochrome c nitrite reductase small subunit
VDVRFETLASIMIGMAVGTVIGLGSYTFLYARGASYLTDNPAACANCHIMQEQFDGWVKASHRAAAACNDCHTPAGFLPKYATKALNGFWHSFAFTTGRFPEPIRIGARNHAVTEQTCRTCHQAIVEAIEGPHRQGASLSCIRCHSEVGHL